MKIFRVIWVLLVGFYLTTFSYGASTEASAKKRLFVVDSYHREYVWSQHISEGFSAALLKFGYLDNNDQVAAFKQNDYTESSRAVVKRLWMDTKRKKSKQEMAAATLKISQFARNFKPDLIFLGDDNAANYIGNQFLDTDIPIVFWGVNNTPVKYGLVDNADRPGHNVTGVYQTTYYKESLQLLKTIVPQAKTFAVLSDNTTTGRIHNKAIMHLDRKGLLPLKLIETVATNDYEDWKRKALDLQDKVDAFFIASSNGLKDKNGITVSNEEAARWYLTHIRIPEAAGFKYRVEHGWLCAADDSGYNQGFEGVVIAHDILAKGADPASYPPRTPKRGPLMVNKQRAKMLGIRLTKDIGIEEYIETASALMQQTPKEKIMVVNSYHKEYFGSVETFKGFCAAMLKFGYFDNKGQIAEYGRNDYVETSKAIVEQLWMDTKRKSTKSEKQAISMIVYKTVREFKPDLLFLGEDNAAQYIGNKFLDSKIPIVFWGVNNTPVKYGLVDHEDRPGHNVTGVYQPGYYVESIKLLKRIKPGIKTFAILTDQTPSGRSHQKKIEFFARTGALPVKLVETVATSDFEEWKSRALGLQEKVDAFFLAQYSGLKDERGEYVPHADVAKWYLTHIKIPEAVGFKPLVEDGMLCAADDSPFNQGFEAAAMGHDILSRGADPATYPPRAPQGGRLMVNRQRAKMLGIVLTKDMKIEEIIEEASALKR